MCLWLWLLNKSFGIRKGFCASEAALQCIQKRSAEKKTGSIRCNISQLTKKNSNHCGMQIACGRKCVNSSKIQELNNSLNKFQRIGLLDMVQQRENILSILTRRQTHIYEYLYTKSFWTLPNYIGDLFWLKWKTSIALYAYTIFILFWVSHSPLASHSNKTLLRKIERGHPLEMNYVLEVWYFNSINPNSFQHFLHCQSVNID